MTDDHSPDTPRDRDDRARARDETDSTSDTDAASDTGPTDETCDTDATSDTDATDATSDTDVDRVLDAASDHVDAPLAAVVAKPRADVATASLQREGVYDDDRRVREFDADTVALPVTDPPADTAVHAVVRQPNPDYRTRDLADHLRDRGWTDQEIDAAPASWAVVGSVVRIAAGDYPNERALGDALLDLHGDADTVVVDDGITGEYRTPTIRVIAGVGDTETVHVEHGTRYALDVADVMFAPGNQAERVHMGDVVDEGERVLDMFAGIGYFALPMARAGATVTAVEANPDAYRYLVENAKLNDVTENLDAILGDCRDVDATADRVVMGYYGVSERDHDAERGQDGTRNRDQEAFDYLDSALDALDAGGVLHVHAAVHESDLPDTVTDRFHAAVDATGYSATVDATGRTATVDAVRTVKSHSAGVAHVVLDATVHE